MPAATLFDRIQKTIATEEELATMPRELQFHPADPHAAKTLNSKQVADFNRDGCLLPIRVYDDDEIAAHRRVFDVQLATTLKSGGDSYSMIDPHLSDARTYDMMFEPRIVDCVRDLIGPNIVCWSTHYFCKPPRESKRVSWHQDAYYWPMTHSRTVTAWLAIDDVDRQNACMQLVAGSHLHGRIEHRATRADEQNVLRFTVDGVEAYGQIVDDELKAGEMSLHADLLLHGSEPNASDRRRCGLTFRYIDAAVQNLKDWHRCGVLICGEDPNDHWANPPRPSEG